MSTRTHPIVVAFTMLQGLRTQSQLPQADPTMRFLSFCATFHERSHAQFFQDLLVLYLLRGKREGFFVEFGATNGVELSNSLLLERDYGWRGILAEPGRTWHAELVENRKATIDHRCVWSKTGETLLFNETPAAELSTIESFSELDYARDGRRDGKRYQVETVSLNDLLAAHNAPRRIDYLSVDTEGSELEILNHFDFSRHEVSVMTIEHNYVDENRRKMRQLMRRNGFANIFEPLSGVDDWYVHQSVLDVAGGAMPAGPGPEFKV